MTSSSSLIIFQWDGYSCIMQKAKNYTNSKWSVHSFVSLRLMFLAWTQTNGGWSKGNRWPRVSRFSSSGVAKCSSFSTVKIITCSGQKAAFPLHVDPAEDFHKMLFNLWPAASFLGPSPELMTWTLVYPSYDPSEKNKNPTDSRESAKQEMGWKKYGLRWKKA